MPKSLIPCTSNMNSSYSKPNPILVLLIITASIFPRRSYILPSYFRWCTRIYRRACDLSWSSNVRKVSQFLLGWYASISFHSCWNESYHEHATFIMSNEFNTYSQIIQWWRALLCISYSNHHTIDLGRHRSLVVNSPVFFAETSSSSSVSLQIFT